MQTILIILGVLTYFAIVIDIIQTTLSIQGGGWLTSRISNQVWNLFLNLSGKNGNSTILGKTGFMLLVIIVMVWVFFLWLSFVLLISSTPDSIISSSTKVPADLWEKIYFAGFTLSTLGMGDYIGSTDIWRIVTSIYSFTGLIILTMSVTYFIPVLSAVIDKRKLGISIRSLGESPQEMVLNSWNGKNFDEFFSTASSLANSLITHSQHHRAYPVIHYFHQVEKKNNVVLQMARLYEAYNILRNCVKEEIRPSEQKFSQLQVAFENYFKVITEVTRFRPFKDSAPEIRFDELKKAGLVTAEKCPAMNAEARQIFHSLIIRDGWKWEDIHK